MSSGGREGGRAFLFVACLSNLSANHASLSWESIVPTPDQDIFDIRVVTTFIPHTMKTSLHMSNPFLLLRPRPPFISWYRFSFFTITHQNQEGGGSQPGLSIPQEIKTRAETNSESPLVSKYKGKSGGHMPEVRVESYASAVHASSYNQDERHFVHVEKRICIRHKTRIAQLRSRTERH